MKRNLQFRLAGAAIVCAVWSCSVSAWAVEEVLPKHITPDTLKAVRLGLEYLARTQSDDGGWQDRKSVV